MAQNRRDRIELQTYWQQRHERRKSKKNSTWKRDFSSRWPNVVSNIQDTLDHSIHANRKKEFQRIGMQHQCASRNSHFICDKISSVLSPFVSRKMSSSTAFIILQTHVPFLNDEELLTILKKCRIYRHKKDFRVTLSCERIIVMITRIYEFIQICRNLECYKVTFMLRDKR